MNSINNVFLFPCRIHTKMFLGEFFALIALVFGLAIYRLYSPMYKKIFVILLVSWFGHSVGTFIYSHIPSDSTTTLFNIVGNEAYIKSFGGYVGTAFVIQLNGIIRQWITGDSIQAIMFLYGILAFGGSVMWYCLFLKVADILHIEKARLFIFPALIILCWPSFLFFTAGMKDGWCFFFIPIFFLSLISLTYGNKKPLSCILVLLSFVLLCLVRPYLSMIIGGAIYLTVLTSGNLKPWLRIVGVVLFLVALSLLVNLAISASASYGSIIQHAAIQQKNLDVGTSFPMPGHGPVITLLLLPYSFIMNLCFPLFILAGNIQGMIQSVENLFLCYLIYFFVRYRRFVPMEVRRKLLIRMLFFFFIVGMLFLALINTNLGLSTREKSMYLPAFLILVALVYLYYSISRIE